MSDMNTFPIRPVLVKHAEANVDIAAAGTGME